MDLDFALWILLWALLIGSTGVVESTTVFQERISWPYPRHFPHRKKRMVGDSEMSQDDRDLFSLWKGLPVEDFGDEQIQLRPTYADSFKLWLEQDKIQESNLKKIQRYSLIGLKFISSAALIGGSTYALILLKHFLRKYFRKKKASGQTNISIENEIEEAKFEKEIFVVGESSTMLQVEITGSSLSFTTIFWPIVCIIGLLAVLSGFLYFYFDPTMMAKVAKMNESCMKQVRRNTAEGEGE